MLHMEIRSDGQRGKEPKSHAIHASTNKKPGLLTTALIQVQIGEKHLELLRLLIESGAQVFFITEEAAQMIGSSKKSIHVEIIELGGNQPKIALWKIEA